MVLVSVELTKKKKVNVDKIRTVPKVSIKMKSSVKKSFFFFYQVPLNGLLRYIVGWVFFLQCRLLRIAHGSPMKAFHCLNITRLICKRCTNDGFIIMTWYLKINCMKDILVHIASAEPLTMHEHQILHQLLPRTTYFGKWNLYMYLWQREEAMHERPLFNTFGRSSGVVSLIGRVNIYLLARYRKPVRISFNSKPTPLISGI